MVKRALGVSLAALALLPVLSAQQDETFSDKVRQLLQEGTDLYKRGKYPEASSKFEEAFQMQPSSDAVYAFIKRAGDDMVASMMNHPDRKIQDIGRRLFELAKPGEPMREGKAVVLKYIEELKSEEHVVWRNAFWHLKNIGPWSVRFLMPVLADKQQDRYRSRVLLLLTEMGVDASLAAVEALDAKEPFVRQNAAIVLGNIKDERAIPALRRVDEDPNEDPNVKKFARESLMKIIRAVPQAQWRKATDYYYELAMKYYYSHSTAILSWQRHYLIWKWERDDAKNVDRITERKVARMAYNEQLAEEAIFDLLELDPNYTDKATGYSPWSLMACVHFAQAIEARAAVLAAVEAFKVGEIDKADLVKLVRDTEGMSDATATAGIGKQITDAASAGDLQTLLTQYLDKLAKVIRNNVVAQLPGKKYVYEALARSLTDGNYLVAKECIATIEQMGRPEDLPAPAAAPDGTNGAAAAPQADPVAGPGTAAAQHGTVGFPLIEALTNEDKRVRYAAAQAMVTLNPQRRKLGMELVIPNLIDALGERGVRVALVIYDVQDDNDRNFMNGFRKLLTSVGVFPVLANTGAEGIVKAKQFPTEDIIIIQRKICGQVYFKESDTKKQIVESVFDTLRDDVRTRNIPRVVLGDTPAEVDESKKEFLEKGTAFAVIAKDTHRLDMQALFEKAFDLPEAKKDTKDRADEIARDAAETLARIDVTNTLYPFRDTIDALINTVKVVKPGDTNEGQREDFIRIPAARALGHFGDDRALDALANVVADKEEGDEAKVAMRRGVRLATSKACSDIFRQTGSTPKNEVFDILMKYTVDGDYDIEMNCGEALGNATLENAQRLKLAKHRRVVRETVTADDP
jgi:HEAT repeat protein